MKGPLNNRGSSLLKHILISLICLLIFSDFPSQLYAADNNLTKQFNQLAYYRKVFDKEYTKNKTYLNSLAACGKGEYYYNFQYILDGTLCMYEATNDDKYLQRALNWAHTMVKKATIIDNDGHKNWPGTYQSGYCDVPISYYLHDLQGSVELARIVKIIKSDSNLYDIHRRKVDVVLSFLEKQIIDKWLITRDYQSIIYNNVSQPERMFSDQTVILMRILLYLYEATGHAKYRDLLTDLSISLKARFQPYAGAIIWDFGLVWSNDINDTWFNVPMDTSHANRYPHAVIELHKSGLIFDYSYVKGLTNLLTKVIWNGSYDSPAFTNYISGENGPFFQFGPWGVGDIRSGWISLGQFDDKVQKIGHYVLKSVESNKITPYSLTHMNSVFAKMELSGHLAKNIRAKITRQQN